MFLIISRMHVRLSTLCVTVSLCFLAKGIVLFPISCIHLELCAHNIFVSHLLSLCWVHVFYGFLSLTLSHKKSSLRGSVAQTADGNKQGSELHGHPYHLVGLRGKNQILRTGIFNIVRITYSTSHSAYEFADCRYHPFEE